MNIESLLQSAVRLGLPLLLAGLGILIASKSGIILIAMEGALELAAFFSVYFCFLTGSALFGQLMAVIVSILYMLLFTCIIIKGQGNQVVSGVGLNFFATGVSSVLLAALMDTKNISPSVNRLPIWDYPLVGQQSSNLLLGIFLAVGVWLLLNYTNFGLRIRAIGENPAAADSLGINVHRYQFLAMILVGILGGIAGSELSIGQMGYYTRSLATTKGYMAFSVVVLGTYRPGFILLASLLVGLIDGLQMRAQTFFDLPGQLFLSMPYLLTIFALIFAKKARGPASEGFAYERE